MKRLFQIVLVTLCLTPTFRFAADSKDTRKPIKGNAAEVGTAVAKWADGLVKECDTGGIWHSFRIGETKYVIVDLHPTSGIRSSDVRVFKLSGRRREVVLEIPFTAFITRQYAIRKSFLEIYKLESKIKETKRSLELRVKLS